MTYEQFKNKYNGKYIDYDGQFGAQCWDLAQKYFTECLGLPASVLGGCGLVSNMLYPPKRQQLDKYFEETNNPSAGDVAIWEYGHIAIYDHKNYYFSQNPNPARVIKITTGGVHFFKLKSKYSVEYRVHCNGRWFNTTSNGGSAGNLKNEVDGYQVKTFNGAGKLYYRCHIKDYGWLDSVAKWDDDENGYAGIINSKKFYPIDAITMWSEHGDLTYRVHYNGQWSAWVKGKYGTNKGEYAGIIGKTIDGLEIKFS